MDMNGSMAETMFDVEVMPLTINSITVKQTPTKTSYIGGESLDLTGGVVEVEMSDYSTFTVPMENLYMYYDSEHDMNWDIHIYDSSYMWYSIDSFSNLSAGTYTIEINCSRMISCDNRSTSFEVEIARKIVNGDANLDGVVTIDDATLIQRYLADLDTIDSEAIESADADGDGIISIKDTTLIQRFLAGISVI